MPLFREPKARTSTITFSAQAWADWQKHQTLLINEKRLNMMNAEDRKYLQGEMDKFFSGEDYAKAEGYVPLLNN